MTRLLVLRDPDGFWQVRDAARPGRVLFRCRFDAKTQPGVDPTLIEVAHRGRATRVRLREVRALTTAAESSQES